MELLKRRILNELSGSEEHDPENNVCEYTYIDRDTQRQFGVRASDGRYLLEEFIPMGRMFAQDGDKVRYWNDDELKVLITQTAPNEFITAAIVAGKDPDCIVFMGAGYGINTIYQESLEACSEAIVSAIQENKRYRPYRELDEVEKTSLAQREQIESAKYWEWRKGVAEKAMQDLGIFKGCHNMSGTMLSAETKHEILSFLNWPTQEAWLGARGLLITPATTLWQAWCDFDEKAPKSGNEGFPSAETLRQAVGVAISSNMYEIGQRLAGTVSLQIEAVASPAP